MTTTEGASTSWTADSLAQLELHEVAQRIASGEVSSVDVTNALLERIRRLDPDLHAFARVTGTEALQAAEAADHELASGIRRSPLHGVPIGVKDLMHTAGTVTANGMSIHGGHVPAEDATVVGRLRDAGAVLIGKLTMTEGAFTQHHPDVSAAVNPWDAQIWAGCSSSGSGVAVAAGLCFGATGSDTGGSIRFPSAQNGVTGLKPTFGRVSRAGVFEMAATLDHIGPMARSARDCALLLEAMAGRDDADPTTSSEPVPSYGSLLELDRTPRIGIDRWLIEQFDGETRGVLASTIRTLEDMGWVVADVHLHGLTELAAVYGTLLAVETAAAHRATYPSHADQYGPELAALIDQGRSADVLDLQEATRKRSVFAEAFRNVLRAVDAVIMPAIGIAAPTVAKVATAADESEVFDMLALPTAPFNTTGSPSITLPAGFTAGGAPLGIQFVGAHGMEAVLLAMGAAFQATTDFHRVRPTL
ncbi:amidase [Rhodococcus koreensis]